MAIADRLSSRRTEDVAWKARRGSAHRAPYPPYYISDLLTRISAVLTRKRAEAEPRVEDSYPVLPAVRPATCLTLTTRRASRILQGVHRSARRASLGRGRSSQRRVNAELAQPCPGQRWRVVRKLVSTAGLGGALLRPTRTLCQAPRCAFVGEASGPGSGPWPDSFDRLVIRLNRSSVELWVFGVLRRQLGQLAMLRIAHRSEPRPTSPV